VADDVGACVPGTEAKLIEKVTKLDVKVIDVERRGATVKLVR
jgi:hypothetical protein